MHVFALNGGYYLYIVNMENNKFLEVSLGEINGNQYFEIVLNIWQRSRLGLCAGVKCKEHARCEVKDGKAQCSCKDIRECPKTSAPVCGQNNETYINNCYLDVENCLMNETVDEQRPGKCGK